MVSGKDSKKKGPYTLENLRWLVSKNSKHMHSHGDDKGVFTLANLSNLSDTEELDLEDPAFEAEEVLPPAVPLDAVLDKEEAAFFNNGDQAEMAKTDSSLRQDFVRQAQSRKLSAYENMASYMGETGGAAMVSSEVPKQGLVQRISNYLSGYVPQPPAKVPVNKLNGAQLAGNAIYGFVEENRQELATVGKGMKHFFARRSLKKKLDEAVELECGFRRVESTEYSNAKIIADNVFDALVPRSEEMSDIYLTTDSMDDKDLKFLVRESVMGYIKDGRVDSVRVQDGVIAQYGAPTIDSLEKSLAVAGKPAGDVAEAPKKKDSLAPSEYVAKPVAQSGFRRVFGRVAATAALAATVFTMGAPADRPYFSAQIAEAETAAHVEPADDVYISYAIEATELPDAETPASETVAPAPRRARSRVARAQAEGSANQYSTDAHTNPRPMDVGQVALQNNNYENLVVEDDMAERPLQFRTRAGARLAALSSGADAYSFDDSNLRLAPAGEGLDYTRGHDLSSWSNNK